MRTSKSSPCCTGSHLNSPLGCHRVLFTFGCVCVASSRPLAANPCCFRIPVWMLCPGPGEEREKKKRKIKQTPREEQSQGELQHNALGGVKQLHQPGTNPPLSPRERETMEQEPCAEFKMESLESFEPLVNPIRQYRNRSKRTLKTGEEVRRRRGECVSE